MEKNNVLAAALAALQAKKNAQPAANAPASPNRPAIASTQPARRTSIERERLLAEYRAGVEARKAERAKKKAEKLAAYANRQAFVSKVDKKYAGLAPIPPHLQEIFDGLTALPPGDQALLATHLGLHVRREQTIAATQRTLEVGMRVRVISAEDPRNIGLIGTLDEVRRIRCFLVPDSDPTRRVYLFTSDVELISDEEDEGDQDEDEMPEPTDDEVADQLDEEVTEEVDELG